MRVTLTKAECELAVSAFGYMTDLLQAEVDQHGTLTKWARKEVRAQLVSLKAKFESNK